MSPFGRGERGDGFAGAGLRVDGDETGAAVDEGAAVEATVGGSGVADAANGSA
jgi:hypothetical protein